MSRELSCVSRRGQPAGPSLLCPLHRRLKADRSYSPQPRTRSLFGLRCPELWRASCTREGTTVTTPNMKEPIKSEYLLDNAWQEARERLRLLEEMHDPGTLRLLDRLGVRNG